ncbi:MAG: heavy metal-responsive transcriptional regulator [Nitrospirota bacterium]|nr:heavy metal-responsive transcriptional regulator [Nitrospirota bacterium]
MTSQHTIGWLANSAGVYVQTVRYYEKRKFLSPSGRRPSGYRIYDNEALTRLRFIRNAQALGFTLREISELLNLRVTVGTCCGDVQGKAEAKLQCVEAKMKNLQTLARALTGLIRTCRAGQSIDRCQILHHMEREQTPTPHSKKRRES